MKAHRRADEVYRYNVWKECSEDIAKSMILAVLFIADRRKWHKDKVMKLYEDIIDLLENPIMIFGKQVSSIDMEAYIVKKYGIDLSRVKLDLASMGSGRKKEKEYGL
jgi:hypothetical protein